MDAAHGSFGVRSIVMLERDRAQKLYSGIVDQRSCTVQGGKRKKVDRRREYMAKEEELEYLQRLFTKNLQSGAGDARDES